MPDFNFRSESPLACFLCGDAVGPYVDTGVNHQLVGRIVICASTDRRSGCVRQMGRLDGLMEPFAVETVDERLQAAADRAIPAIAAMIEDQTNDPTPIG